MPPKVSIIVPVYKVEAYLPVCLESISSQTFQDFELILVDDGSPDNCGAMCEEYAAQNPNTRVIPLSCWMILKRNWALQPVP